MVIPLSSSDEFDYDFDSIIESAKQREQELAASEAELLAVRQQLMEAEAAMHKIRLMKNNLVERISSTKSELRSLEIEKQRAERFKAAKEKRDQLIAEYNEKATVLDALTNTATWREFAYPHQIEGGKRLAIAERGILGDKRGLGKTLTSLIYLDMVRANKILIIAPNDVVPQFEDEIRHWAAHRKIMSFAGLNKDQRKIIYPMLRMLDAFVITINYEAWRRDKTIIDDLVAAGIDTVILDEAHRAKSFAKITAQGIIQAVHAKNYCPSCSHMVDVDSWYQNKKMTTVDPTYAARCKQCNTPLESTVKNLLAMTGTPILNKPQELFTMLYLVDPFRFNSESQYLRDYCYSNAPGRWRFLPGGLERLTKHMSEFFVQRTREDAGIVIPPPKVTIHYLEPDPVGYPAQWKAYKDLTEAAALVLEDGTAVSMLYILEIILRERQIMTWPAGVELKLRDDEGEVVDVIHFDVHESQKLDAAVELMQDLAEEGERFICFSKFKEPLYEAKRRLMAEGHKVTTATGDDLKTHKNRVREDFDLKTADPDNPKWVGVFATFDAFATGVNLNAARHAIFLDDEWNPGMEDQAIGRIDRLNSTDQANVHIFRVKKSVDIFMEKLIDFKKEVAEGFEEGISKQRLVDHIRGGGTE